MIIQNIIKNLPKAQNHSTIIISNGGMRYMKYIYNFFAGN